VGGDFEYEGDPLHPFIKDLPRYIHIGNVKTKEQYWLNQAAELLFEEITNERPGSKILIDRMAEILFIHTMRAYLAQSTQVSGFLSAFKDERISKVLGNIHIFCTTERVIPGISSADMPISPRKIQEYIKRNGATGYCFFNWIPTMTLCGVMLALPIFSYSPTSLLGWISRTLYTIGIAVS